MERKRVNAVVLSVVVLFSLVPVTLAQRGMGDATGVVRQGLTPKIVTLQGRVMRILTGPCEKSTGPSELGTHFILKTEQSLEQNIHLGPAHLVQAVTALLSGGGDVSVSAFRTNKMPEGHYNAVTVTLGNNMIRLRAQNLRPVWAGTMSSGPRGSETGQVKSCRDLKGHLGSCLGGAHQCLQRSCQCGRFQSSGKRCRGRGRCGRVGQPRCGKQRYMW